MIKKCALCKKEFQSFPCRKRLFCSQLCSNRLKDGTFKKGHKWVGKCSVNKRVMSHGYIEIYMPAHPYKNVRNSVLEHRLIMEKHLGRYLDKKEVVHHINGIKNDNRIENLQLFKCQADHIKYGHAKIINNLK